jgi:hypothetical protein
LTVFRGEDDVKVNRMVRRHDLAMP